MSEYNPGISRRDLLRYGLYGFGALSTGAAIGGGGEFLLHKYIRNPSSGIDEYNVNTNTLPEKLPYRVRAVQDSILFIYGFRSRKIVEQFSGIKIGEGLVLTAGHGFKKDNGTLYPLASCPEDLWISGNSTSGRVDTHSADAVSTFVSNSSIPDISLISTVDSLDRIPTIKIGEGIKPGDDLYFINFQPTPDGYTRFPASQNRLLRYPAIYGGVAYGTDKSQVAVKLNLRSYGVIPDARIRAGASGGAVVNNKGELVAISDADLTNSHGDIAFIQPITPAIINKYSTKLHHHPNACSEITK